MDWGINELSSAFNLRSNEMTYTRAQQIISEYLNRGYNPTTKKIQQVYYGNRYDKDSKLNT
jgi:hypothetical protein